jgi:hypothetical protein
VKGLRLDKQDGTWVQTPVPDSATCKIIRQADLTLTDDGALEGTVTEIATGLEGLCVRLSEIWQLPQQNGGAGKSLVYTRTFEIKEVSVPLDKIDDLKKFYRIIGSDERGTAVLKTAH